MNSPELDHVSPQSFAGPSNSNLPKAPAPPLKEIKGKSALRGLLLWDCFSSLFPASSHFATHRWVFSSPSQREQSKTCISELQTWNFHLLRPAWVRIYIILSLQHREKGERMHAHTQKEPHFSTDEPIWSHMDGKKLAQIVKLKRLPSFLPFETVVVSRRRRRRVSFCLRGGRNILTSSQFIAAQTFFGSFFIVLFFCWES